MKNYKAQQINHDSSGNNKGRILPIWIFRILTALAFDIVLTLILLYTTLHFSGIWYTSHRSITDPIERGDDLGTMLFSGTIAYYVFFISFPVLFIIFYKSIRKYLKDN